MLYIPKISVSLKILTDQEVKNLVAIHFSEYFKSIREALYSKLSEKQDLAKIAILLYIFLTTPDEVEKYVEIKFVFNLIKNKLKESLSDLKKFKVQIVLVLDYKKRNDHKILDSFTKITAGN